MYMLVTEELRCICKVFKLSYL